VEEVVAELRAPRAPGALPLLGRRGRPRGRRARRGGHRAAARALRGGASPGLVSGRARAL